MNKKALRGATSVFATLLAAGAAQAQSMVSNDPAKARSSASAPRATPLRSAADTAGVQDIVVTARRTSENLQNVPLSISAFTPSKLKDLGIRNLPDIGKQTPSLITNPSPNDPSGSLVYIRGLGAPDILINVEPAVAIYTDGVYLPQSIGLSAALVDVQRVEVLKGPQGTLYGKNTTGGAISITSRSPNLEDANGYIDTRFGNYGLREVTAAVSVPLVTDQLAVRFAVQHTGHDGYGHDLDGRDLDAVDNNTFRGHITWHPSDKLSIDILGDYSAVNNSGVSAQIGSVADSGFALVEVAAELGLDPTNPANLVTAKNALASLIGKGGFYDNDSNVPQASDAKSYGTSATIAYSISDSVQIKSITGERWLRRDTQSDIDGTHYNILYADQVSDDRVFSQELQLIGKEGRLSWIAGGYYGRGVGYDNTKAYSLSALNPINPTGLFEDAFSRTIGVFAQGTYNITDTVRFTGGVRYSRETRDAVAHNYNALGCALDPSFDLGNCTSPTLSRKDDGVSYLASVDWHITPNVMVYAKTSRGSAAAVSMFVRIRRRKTRPSDLSKRPITRSARSSISLITISASMVPYIGPRSRMRRKP